MSGPSFLDKTLAELTPEEVVAAGEWVRNQRRIAGEIFIRDAMMKEKLRDIFVDPERVTATERVVGR